MKLEHRRIRRRLLAWYRRNARDLPWRRDGDPYRIWISEVMLQQTRVEAAREHYRRFLARFPGVAELAAAGEDEVLACWSGLGYYGRARNLHRAARRVAEEHGGLFPSRPAEALRLPGVGPYTAGAVLSIAYGLPVPAVDGNVKRVLSRLFALEGDPDRSGPRRELEELAAGLVKGVRPGDWNQALMELGAAVCTPRSPSCGDCPLSGGLCAAEAAGRQEDLPRKRRGSGPVREELAAAAVLKRGRILLVRDPGGGLVKGLWELPWVPLSAGAPEEAPSVGAALGRRYRFRVEGLERVGEVRHAIMRRSLRISAYRGRAAGRDGVEGGGWFARSALAGLPLSALARKVLAVALSG